MMDRQPLQPPRRVFISSTVLDLAQHRAVVIDTVERLQLFADNQEQFGARAKPAIAESVSAVELADIYLGIFAWRYGTIKPGETHSISHLEYDEAERLNLPRLIFLANPSTEPMDNPIWPYPEAVRDPDHDEQRRAFRQLLQDTQVVDTFTTPENLGWRAAIALFNLIMHEVPARLRMPRDLPPRAVGFVGRDAELRQVLTAMRAGHNIGVAAAVAGMGGVGKSALAAEAVHQIAADLRAFPGGITWARCDGRVGPEGQVWVYDQLLTRWDQSLSPQELAAATTPEAQVDQREQALRRLGLPGTALVLLDNVEPQLPLAMLLDFCASQDITVLVTSRSLSASPRLTLCELNVLEPDPAVALFVERYQAQGGAWDEQRDRVAALEVVETLGRLPLALELAAARAAHIKKSVTRLAQELREPDVLGKLRDPLDPTASVRYSLQKSLDLLTPAQRIRFAALGLPQGPDWPQPIILALLSAVPPDAADTPTAEDDLILLATLSLASLVAPESDTSVGLPMRVRLHPLLRALTQDEWRQLPTETQEAAVSSLLAGVIAFIKEHRREFAVLQQEEEMWAGAIRQAAQMQVAVKGIIAAVYALQDYLYIGGHWQVGIEMLQLFLTVARQKEDQGKEGYALGFLGLLADVLGHKEEARRYDEGALVILREVGDRLQEGTMLNNLGSLTNSMGRKEEAQHYFEQALMIRREVGDRRGEGTTLNNLGELARSLGRKEEAQDYYEQSLVIRREVGDRRGEGTTLNNLGLLADSLGRKEEAQDYYEQALVIRREVGDRQGEGVTLNNLGAFADDLGRKEEAEEYYAQSLVIRREVGDRYGEGATLNNLGWLAESLGRREAAIQDFEQALALFEDMGMESEAQREREALAILRKEDSMADVDTTLVEDVVEMPAPDVVIVTPTDVMQVEHKPDAERKGWRWFWQR